MVCHRARESYSRGLTGERLTPLVRLATFVHMQVCPSCRRYRQSMEGMQVALKGLRDSIPPLLEKADSPNEERTKSE
jgi:predicted anti-sigma-YlaC factor YlaD